MMEVNIKYHDMGISVLVESYPCAFEWSTDARTQEAGPYRVQLLQ